MRTGFTNSFTSGEISEDGWDRTDLQPIAKGCEEATNLVVRIAGPLGKRRGFWRNGAAIAAAVKPRLVPFRRSIDDALMLEFGDGIVRLWNNNGAPFLNAGNPVTFASPYTAAQLDGLRWKQVADVIYFRHRDGLPPQTLERVSNTVWVWTLEFFPNGPWRTENTDDTFTITVTGADESDALAETGAGSIAVDQVVTLAASKPIWNDKHVGSKWRLRQTDGNPGAKAWSVGNRPAVGTYCVSNGKVYRSTHQGGFDSNVTNPPAQDSGSQSDGGNIWDYRHDGAGVVRIDQVFDAQNAQGTVRRTLPFKSGIPTKWYAEGAWSNFRGWPRMWPSVREERFVEGATASNLDYVDLSQTAGFTPISETFTPGLGSGLVVATDAVRRRLGDDSSELIWSLVSTYLLIGSTSGEYLVAGSVLDEGISPTAVVVKQLSDFGSSDHLPVKAHSGVIYITRGQTTLRELAVDTSQVPSGQDLTVLARHIADRGLAQLAWVPQPDETLWIRLADGGLAVMVYHKEQQVRGFCRVALPEGFTCEDMAVLPGPGRFETLWLAVTRQKGQETQRQIWMLSAVADSLFTDCAETYAGPPVTQVAGLDHLEGETVRVLANGVQQPDRKVVGGVVTLDAPAGNVLVGLPYKVRFKSLRFDTQLGGALNELQRVAGVAVSVKTVACTVGLEGKLAERVSARSLDDIPGPKARRQVQHTTIAADTDRDPRLVIEEDSAYDFVLYSLKPEVVVGG